MEALALVPKFQEKLDIPKAEAIWRVIGFLFFSTCLVVVTAVAIAIFPYAAGFTDEVSLLPGNHIQVSEILDGEVLVSKTQFLKAAEGNTTFISIGEEIITYMTKAGGVSYRYEQNVPVYRSYSISSFHIENGTVIREMGRATKTMIISNIIFPLLLLAIFFALSVSTQQKRVSGWGSSAVYREVWV